MSDFQSRVFDAVSKIPRGRVASYKDIAYLSGSERASRAVGNILHNNPLPYVIPCHRVVHSDGATAPAFAFGGESKQRELLENEGITFINGKVDIKKHRWQGKENVK